MKESMFSPKEAISYGWQVMKDHLPLFIPLCLMSWLISSTIGALQRPAPTGAAWGGHGLLVLVLQLVNLVLAMGWIRISLLLHDHKPAALTEILNVTWPSFFNYLITSFLYGLIVAGGMVLLIVPGVVWAIRFSLAPLLVIDQGLEPMAALRRSGELTAGVKTELFVLGLALLGINILGALCLGIGLFATIPASMMAAVQVYRKLLARGAGLPHPGPQRSLDEHPVAV